MKFRYFLITILSTQIPAFAQTMYKCGSTYSQTPCANNAQKIEVKPALEVDCSNYNHIFSDACRGKSPANNMNSVTEARNKVQKQIDSMPAIVPPSAEAIETNKKRCLARINAMLKDPESARIGEIRRASGPEPDYETSRGWFPSISYTVGINAKNSYGGYTGSKVWACSFDLKEKEILRARSFD